MRSGRRTVEAGRYGKIITLTHPILVKRIRGEIMAQEKKPDIKTGKEKGGGLTPSERVILEKSMVRHDKALKILSKL